MPARKQPSGLPIFAAAAALLVGRISIKDMRLPKPCQSDAPIYVVALSRIADSLLFAPCSNAKSLATRPFPIYEMGSNVKHHPLP